MPKNTSANLEFIPVNVPVLSPKAETYVLDCIRSGWISSAGAYIGKFESAFASFTGTRHAITATNGTAALNLAVLGLEIGPGDEVIIPDLTIISCALAVLYAGATPVFVDVDPVTLTLDPALIEAKITPRTKAIMAVDLYGHPADWDAIRAIAGKHGIPTIEDAAEAHGALYKGHPAGSLGTVGVFSFYANKIITSGEGGMVVTNDAAVADRMRLLKDLAHDPARRFWHNKIGYNYRMTNVSAAIGLAQLESVDEYIAKKLWMAQTYAQALAGTPYITLPTQQSWARSVYWMYALTLSPDAPVTKQQLREQLKTRGIDTRDFFYPLHEQPILNKYSGTDERFPVSVRASQTGFYVPSGLAITEEQIRRVAKALKEILRMQ